MPVHPREVTYEAFGASGDGVADDLPAICAAHAHANANDLPVRSRPEATYHLGRQALTAVIATDTDWNTSRFIIDDTDVDDHKKSLFEVASLLPPAEVSISRLERNQKCIEARPAHDCHVFVESEDRNVYIRRGLNQNQGVAQHDCFVLHRDGTIEGDIDWTYERITRIDARPIDPAPLTVRGGVFTTIANRMRQEVGYNYWARNIDVTRSNTVIDGLTHYVVGETATGHPYRGFLSVRNCANATLRDCFVSGHKIYSTIGAAGKPVRMGSYDLAADNVVNLHLRGCRMNHILDRTRWGVIGTNFCKNILLEDCVLSRMDTHQGVSGSYVFRRCTLGHMGLNAIGRGRLLLEDSTVYGWHLLNFRTDYGSTWEGKVVIKHCRWIPRCGDTVWPHMINAANDGMHDFGYPCSMPHTVEIDGLVVEDDNTPAGYDGLFLFVNHDANESEEPRPPMNERPHPYGLCRRIRIRGLTTASGMPVRVSPHPDLADLPCARDG